MRSAAFGTESRLLIIIADLTSTSIGVPPEHFRTNSKAILQIADNKSDTASLCGVVWVASCRASIY